MDLTEEDQATIEGGLQAEALLGMEFFTTLVKDLALESAISILDVDPEDPKGPAVRERLYQRAQGIQAVLTELHARVGAKETIMVRLEQEASENPSDDTPDD